MKGKQINMKHCKAATSHICDIDGKVIKKGEHYTMAQGMPKGGKYPIARKFCLSHDWSMVRQTMLSKLGY